MSDIVTGQTGRLFRSKSDAVTGQIGHDYETARQLSDIPSESVSEMNRNGCQI